MEDSENIKSRQESEKEVDEMALKEQRELEAAKRERMELIAAEQKSLAAQHAVPNQEKATLQEKFQYLVSQSEVFAHFLAGKCSFSGQFVLYSGMQVLFFILCVLTVFNY